MLDFTQLRRSARLRELARQIALVFGAAIFYFLVRGLTQGSRVQANHNAETVLRVEKWVGLDIETWAQDLVLDHRWVVTISNWTYIWGHWPVIIITLYSLHRWTPDDYLRLRNALFVSGAIGILIYVTFPVAPPRLLDPVYTDTVTEFSTSYRVFQPPALVNKYAAMPSLHAGWNLLAGIVLFQATNHRVLRLLAIAGPTAMALAVVLTANHYVLDVVVGAMVALTGLALSLRWWPHPGGAGAPAHRGGGVSRGVEIGVVSCSDAADQVEVVEDQRTNAGSDEVAASLNVFNPPRCQPRGQSA